MDCSTNSSVEELDRWKVQKIKTCANLEEMQTILAEYENKRKDLALVNELREFSW